jgi:hypothetical protein
VGKDKKKDDDSIRLKQRPYMQTGNEVFEIVPPHFGKEIEGEIYQALWKRAERAIRLARALVLIGFSFTPTDLHVDSLVRTALAGNGKLERLVIVNPSPTDRRRIRAVCAGALSRRDAPRVVQFDTFAEFAPHAGRVLIRKGGSSK